MRDDLGFFGIVAKQWQEVAAEAHWQLGLAVKGRVRGLPPGREPCLGKEAFLPVGPTGRLIAYFPEGKQSCEAASFSQEKAPIHWLPRSRNSLPVKVIAAKEAAPVNGPVGSQRIET